MSISSGTLTNSLKRSTGLYDPDGCSSSSVRVSPNEDAQASNSWIPRTRNASPAWKRSKVYISPRVLVIGVPEDWMSARPGFRSSMKRDFTNRSHALCDPSGSTPFRLIRLVAKLSLRNSWASSTISWSTPISSIVSMSSRLVFRD